LDPPVGIFYITDEKQCRWKQLLISDHSEQEMNQIFKHANFILDYI
jgi:hypothetical protein